MVSVDQVKVGSSFHHRVNVSAFWKATLYLVVMEPPDGGGIQTLRTVLR